MWSAIPTSHTKQPSSLVTPTNVNRSQHEGRCLFPTSSPHGLPPALSCPVVNDTPPHNKFNPASNFVVSPFGLLCSRADCPGQRRRDEPNVKMVQHHLKLHLTERVEDECSTSIQAQRIMSSFQEIQRDAIAAGSVDAYRADNKIYNRHVCTCDAKFEPPYKQNAIRHARNSLECDVTRLTTEPVVKLCCGRYVSNQEHINDFLEGTTTMCNTVGAEYDYTWKIIQPLLREIEKRDQSYTHMYYALVEGCCTNGTSFLDKVKSDSVKIHSKPGEEHKNSYII